MGLYIWGTSKLAEIVLVSANLHPIAFLDSNPKKWGTEHRGKLIVSPGSIDASNTHIVIASVFFPEIYRDAEKLGVPTSQISIASESQILTPGESQKLMQVHDEHQQWRQTYIETHLSAAEGFGSDREGHLRHAAEAAEQPGLVLEFGVFEGASIQVLSKVLNQQAFGFDTFEGLPEDWTQFHQKGFFDLQGTTPVLGDNIRLVKGLFQDTLDSFLKEHSSPIRLIHCDADLYSSTSFVLDKCTPHIQVGTVMIFDDFLYELDYDRCDFRAFMDLVSDNRLEYTFLSYDVSGSVAILVTGLG